MNFLSLFICPVVAFLVTPSAGITTWSKANCDKVLGFIGGLDAACKKPYFSVKCPESIKACPNGYATPKPTQPPPTEAPAPQSSGGGGGGGSVGYDPSDPKQAALKKCCEDQGVPASCIDICRYSQQEQSTLACKSECFDHVKKWMYCAANGQNNQPCCTQKGVPGHCNNFCNGKTEFPKLNTIFKLPGVQKYLECFSTGSTIMKCHYDNSPSEENWDTNKKWESESVPPLMKPFITARCKE